MITYVEAQNSSVPVALRNQLCLLISTPVGTVALDRDFGIDTSCVDMPMDAAQTMLAAELADKIGRYIPRLALREVILTGAGEDGELELKVVVDYEE